MKPNLAGTMTLHATPHPNAEDTSIPFPEPSPETETRRANLYAPTIGDDNIGLGLKFLQIGKIAEVNKELWLILSMLILLAVMNYMVTSHRLLLGLYALPTLFSAYSYGRRHATLTAFASVLLVGLLAHQKTGLFVNQTESMFVDGRWYDITAWGGTLLMEHSNPLQVFLKLGSQFFRKNGLTILLPLSHSDDNDTPPKIDVLNSQLQTFVQSHAGSIHEVCHQKVCFRKAGKKWLHLLLR
jgi:hypothetical protein